MAKQACVLGAGIQGSCVALMLAKNGYQVMLLDRSSDIINRTSLTYEGKIHLGFVYGMDKSLATGKKMIHDALHFGPYLEYLLDCELDWDSMRSLPNDYLVAQDSMLSATEASAYFEQLQQRYLELLADERLHYLGLRPETFFQPTAMPDGLNPNFAQACFRTIEASVDQLKLKELIRAKIQTTSEIDLLTEHAIEQVAADTGGFVTKGCVSDGSAFEVQSELVCNCLWEERIRIDRSFGIEAQTNQSIRLKYGLLVETDQVLEQLHSFTVIHGPYGNFVNAPQSSRAFFSWYPACLKGLIDYDVLPSDWQSACDGHTSEELKEQLRLDNLSWAAPGLGVLAFVNREIKRLYRS